VSHAVLAAAGGNASVKTSRARGAAGLGIRTRQQQLPRAFYFRFASVCARRHSYRLTADVVACFPRFVAIVYSVRFRTIFNTHTRQYNTIAVVHESIRLHKSELIPRAAVAVGRSRVPRSGVRVRPDAPRKPRRVGWQRTMGNIGSSSSSSRGKRGKSQRDRDHNGDGDGGPCGRQSSSSGRHASGMPGTCAATSFSSKSELRAAKPSVVGTLGRTFVVPRPPLILITNIA